MRLRRLSALALLGAGTVAACEPDNAPDITAPGGYTLDLRTTPATVTLGTTAADSATGVRVTTAVHNTAITDTTLQRVAVISGGLPVVRLRFQDPADSLKFTFTNAPGLTGNLAGSYAPAAVSATPGLFNFNVRRRRTTAASSGTSAIIVEFTDVNNNLTLADTVRVTSN